MGQITIQTNWSIARIWDEQALAGIRVDTPNPPVQARNFFSFAVAMYDAWSAYDTNGSVGFIYHGKSSATNVALARREAISYAVYQMMLERHAYSKTAATTLASDSALLQQLGYDTNNQSRDLSTPAGLGNTVYDAVSAWFINDGARQTNGTAANPYPDYPPSQGGYKYVNPPLVTALEGIDDGSGNGVADINHWQRLEVANAVDQNGFPTGPIQNYLGAQWLGVRPYGLARINPNLPWIDPGPPPALGFGTNEVFRAQVVSNIVASSQLTPDDGVTIDTSPASYGNNSLLGLDGHGYPLNPATGQPYAPNIVKRGDYGRVIAEFWADGPNSETPPGHWDVIANYVSDNPLLVKRIGGAGPVVDNLEWDVKVYFALNAAVHEAACAAWAVKRFYTGWRPISAIRYMGGLGQSSDPALPSYSAKGLPIMTNLIELVTAESVASGRHAGLRPGKMAIHTWPGAPADPSTQYQGVKWIQADMWLPYQRTNFVTPSFPGYISGHTTFSRCAAEVLAGITGSPFFPGGLGVYNIPATTGLKFELGPSQSVQLQWATYFDAADEAGLSRIYGGIHPPIDNLAARPVASAAGKGVWAAAQKYFDGSIARATPPVTIRSLGGDQAEIRFGTYRGMYYLLQSGPGVGPPFTNALGGVFQATDASTAVTNSVGGIQFFRSIQSLSPQ